MLLQSESIAELAKALSATQGELEDAAKTAINPAFKSPDKPKGSSYADLAEVLQTIRPVAARHGLSFVQGVGYTAEDGAEITTRLMHSSGQWVQETLNVPVVKKDAQGLGSALTYGRRYSIAAMFGIAQDDDDANAAAEKPKAKPAKTQGPYTRWESATTYRTTERAADLIASFNTLQAGDNDQLKNYSLGFSSLTPDEQADVMPAAKAARTRVQGSK